MKIRVQVIAWGFVLVCLAAASSYGQDKSSTNDTSLGDLARAIRAQKAKETKPARVITTDTISHPDDASGISGSSRGKSSTSSAPAGSEAKTPAHGEEYYHSQMSTLQGKLDTHTHDVDLSPLIKTDKR